MIHSVALNLLIYSCLTISQNIDKTTELALSYFQNGYIIYGVNLLESASVQNDLYAQFYMAECYYYGIGVNRDLSHAFKWARRAAERGLPDAMKLLSDICSEKGDIEKSNSWRERFIKKGGEKILPSLNKFIEYGKTHPENYALNPTKSDQSTPIASYTPESASQTQIINNYTIINPPNNNTNVSSDNKPYIENKKTETTSDVDVNIPTTIKKDANTFVLIISNENYQDNPDVEFASNDGYIMAEYFNKTLGIPKSNIRHIKNATLNNLKKEIKRLCSTINLHGSDTKAIIYYSGHGFPDEITKNAYILPVDGDISDISTCYKLQDLYSQISSSQAKKSIVLLDACFTGSQRGCGMIESSRGITIKPKRDHIEGKLIVLTACEGDQSAYPYPEKNHGLFTYYLLKYIRESTGELTLGELYEFLNEKIEQTSLLLNGKNQKPSIIVSDKLISSWKTLPLN